MRARVGNLKLGQQEISKTVRPQLVNLEREVKDLNLQIIDMYKRVEGNEDKIY